METKFYSTQKNFLSKSLEDLKRKKTYSFEQNFFLPMNSALLRLTRGAIGSQNKGNCDEVFQ